MKPAVATVAKTSWPSKPNRSTTWDALERVEGAHGLPTLVGQQPLFGLGPSR